MTAKEMFEELGWKLTFKSSHLLTYEKKSRSGRSRRIIQFLLKYKEFCINEESTFAQSYSLKELKAINKQIEELEWNND